MNKIKGTVKSICAQAGSVGNFTNHSLRATCASRMYEKRSTEQLIKEVMGHKSDCVRNYKRTSDALKEKASAKVSKIVDEPSTSNGIKGQKEEKVVSLEEITGGSNDSKELLSISQMIKKC